MCGFLNYKAKLNGVLAWGLDEGLTTPHKTLDCYEMLQRASELKHEFHSNESSGSIKSDEFD